MAADDFERRGTLARLVPLGAAERGRARPIALSRTSREIVSRPRRLKGTHRVDGSAWRSAMNFARDTAAIRTRRRRPTGFTRTARATSRSRRPRRGGRRSVQGSLRRGTATIPPIRTKDGACKSEDANGGYKRIISVSETFHLVLIEDVLHLFSK